MLLKFIFTLLLPLELIISLKLKILNIIIFFLLIILLLYLLSLKLLSFLNKYLILKKLNLTLNIVKTI